MRRGVLIIVALLGLLICVPPQWYPVGLRLQLASWLGVPADRGLPDSVPPAAEKPEPFCPPDPAGWRKAQVIEGVQILESKTCEADNPYLVAASVRGTNRVSPETLMASGLTPDAVEKGRDLDGDGDPDEIHIRLEVAELNGGSPEAQEPITQYEIAPGIHPGFWVFVPKHTGMSTENFASRKARWLLRMPSPAIRVEQGDHVLITLENTHYMPHTLHLHGTDHGFVDVSGEGNDGVPLTSELPVMPGQSRTYELTPREAGTKYYHCHVQPHIHVMMGLQGLFVIEENRPDNWVQTLNVGAGQVRVPSKAVREQYDQEYDLHYTDVDIDLNRRIQVNNDVRLIAKSMNRDYDATDAVSDYFELNGKSFPYTFRESLVVVEPGQRIKLRVVDGGRDGIALHTHGHTMTVTARDGHEVPEVQREVRDVVWLAPAQRLDLELDTTNDGKGAYGAGIWLFHDHGSRMTTTDGIGPGGHISAIVYDQFLDANGWPRTAGVDWSPYFTAAYYRRATPVWESYAPGEFADVARDPLTLARLLLGALFAGMLLALLAGALGARR